MNGNKTQIVRCEDSQSGFNKLSMINDDVVFKGNTATSNAGGLYWNSTRGTLINGSFINNVGLVGGAIYWYGSYGALDNLTFKNNNATSYAGAVYVGHIFVSVKNCNFDPKKMPENFKKMLLPSENKKRKKIVLKLL